MLEAEIHFPVIIENDVNLGAVGIKNFGVGKKANNMLAVFIGTGIGGGLIIEGKLYRGSNFGAEWNLWTLLRPRSLNHLLYHLMTS